MWEEFVNELEEAAKVNSNNKLLSQLNYQVYIMDIVTSMGLVLIQGSRCNVGLILCTTNDQAIKLLSFFQFKNFTQPERYWSGE